MISARFRDSAIRDIAQLYAYITQYNPDAAVEVARHIYQMVELLKLFPEMGVRGRVKGTYEFSVSKTPYIIVYKILPKYVDIIGVFHGARKR